MIDLTGMKFGRLTVVAFANKKLGNDHFWECLCECGTTKIIRGRCFQYSASTTVSCGCHKREIVKKVNTKHGMYKMPIYGSWCHMKGRCENPNNEKYKDYGGRGIVVCKRWHAFDNFLADMGPSHFKGATIERKDVNGNYCPENCEWISAGLQARNKRKTIDIETVREIKSDYKSGIRPKALAEKYQVKYRLIRSIVYEEAWRDVSDKKPWRKPVIIEGSDDD